MTETVWWRTRPWKFLHEINALQTRLRLTILFLYCPISSSDTTRVSEKEKFHFLSLIVKYLYGKKVAWAVIEPTSKTTMQRAITFPFFLRSNFYAVASKYRKLQEAEWNRDGGKNTSHETSSEVAELVFFPLTICHARTLVRNFYSNCWSINILYSSFHLMAKSISLRRSSKKTFLRGKNVMSQAHNFNYFATAFWKASISG